MNRITDELLHGVPAGADYAVDATELDREDIPQSRVDALIERLHTHDRQERFLASKLLTSWGYREGLAVLEKDLEAPERLEGFFTHRLHGYDDTLRHVLLAVIGYFSNRADLGEAEQARAEVYAPLSRLISLAATRPFEISAVFDFIRREGFLEYMPSIEQYFLAIIEQPETLRWSIVEAAEFLSDLNAGFVLSVLQSKGLSIDDFKRGGRNGNCKDDK